MLSCCARRNILNLPCLVHGDSSGAGGSLFSGHGGRSQPPAPLSLRWKRLLRDPVRAPDTSSCPEEASASELSPGGLPVPVGCRVPVLSCLSSLGGLLIPPNFPREIVWGGKRVPAVGAGPRGPRPRPQGPPAMAPELPALPWPPEPLATPWSPELPAPPWPPELPAPPWSPLSVCSALEVPVLCSCPCLSRGASRAPAPPPRWNCYGVGHAFREGGVMSGFCCVCHLFLPHVSIFGLFPVLVKCHYELTLVQLCLCRYL